MTKGFAALVRLLERFTRQYPAGGVIPSQEWISCELKRHGHRASIRSVNRWIAKLKAETGILEVQARGPKSASYKLRQNATPKSIKNGVAFGVAFGVASRSAPYINLSGIIEEERIPPQTSQEPHHGPEPTSQEKTDRDRADAEYNAALYERLRRHRAC